MEKELQKKQEIMERKAKLNEELRKVKEAESMINEELRKLVRSIIPSSLRTYLKHQLT